MSGFNPRDVNHFLESGKLRADADRVLQMIKRIHQAERDAAVERAELDVVLEQAGSQRLRAIVSELDGAHKADLAEFHRRRKSSSTKKPRLKKRKSSAAASAEQESGTEGKMAQD
jgi:hypothetical protein